MSRTGTAIVAVLAAAIAAGATAGYFVWRAQAPAGATASAPAVRYHCPMHPSIISDKPGECPICHMTLVPMETAGTSAPAEETPAENRSIEATGIPGLAAVRIPAGKQQLIGVTTDVAKVLPFRREIRAVGRVTADENRLWQVHTKVPGYVETLFIRAKGETVLRGAPLLSLDSPDLQAAEQEYLVAYHAARRAQGSVLPSVSASAQALLDSARKRLELLDITPDQIKRIETTGRAERTYILYAPISGTALSRDVEVGQRVDLDTKIMDLADLSHVWVLASVYEYEAPYVYLRQKATMTLSYIPGERYDGWVTLVYPFLDPATRTVQLRLEFDNDVGALKPDMYADVVLDADLGRRLSIPDSAVLRSGTRNVVFVAKGDGVFEPREVKLGVELPDRVEVVRGISAGERVVTGANFLVDSESKLKAATAAMKP
jgi:Cu(I)/Ag(I) efflux system membrane fusion protein